MIENSAPEKLTKPFCDIGLKNTIPKDAGAAPQDATYTYGFPLVTMTPISQGGLPPKGKDFNGILYEISSHTRWVNAGGVFYKFDRDFCTSIGGYPKGAVLLSNDGLSAYISTIDGNTTNFNEDLTTENWKAWAGEALAPAVPETGKVFSNNNAFSYFMSQL